MPSDRPATRTIPEVLQDAARRDPDGIWVRTDDGELSFSGALARVAAAAQDLRAAGVNHGDLVMVTARTTPQYLICWLALARQTQPRALITDQGLAALVSQAEIGGLPPLGTLDSGELAGDWTGSTAPPEPLPASGVSPDDLAVLIPTSGTTGRSKLVMQTHRAYVMAGEGFPYWMELTAQDRLMT